MTITAAQAKTNLKQWFLARMAVLDDSNAWSRALIVECASWEPSGGTALDLTDDAESPPIIVGFMNALLGYDPAEVTTSEYDPDSKGENVLLEAGVAAFPISVSDAKARLENWFQTRVDGANEATGFSTALLDQVETWNPLTPSTNPDDLTVHEETPALTVSFVNAIMAFDPVTVVPGGPTPPPTASYYDVARGEAQQQAMGLPVHA